MSYSEIKDYTFNLMYGGLLFHSTCTACPEQYDVYDPTTEKLVGYVRLRWGCLRVECPDVFGEEVYWHEFDDGMLGIFETNYERDYHLDKAAQAINAWLAKKETKEF